MQTEEHDKNERENTGESEYFWWTWVSCFIVFKDYTMGDIVLLEYKYINSKCPNVKNNKCYTSPDWKISIKNWV